MCYSKSIGMLFCFLAAGALIQCTFTEKIKDGRTAYERKRYFQASEMLQDEFKLAGSNIDQMNIAHLIGDCHIKFGDFEGAAEWYKTAYEGGYGAGALASYAHTLKQLEQYEEAANAYVKAGDELGDRIRFRPDIAACIQAVEWRDGVQYSPYVIENLKINSLSSDYAAFPLSKNQIAFTSDREGSTGDLKYAWSGNDFSDLFIADLDQNEIRAFEGVNREDNEGTAATSPDGQSMVFCRCFSRDDYDAHCKLLIAQKVENSDSWTRPTIMSFIKDGINYRQPTFTEDGQSIIFSANIDEATNDYDLYMSTLEEGSWQDPVSLGSRINSQKREAFPFMYFDTLYFASNVSGMGGLDIYRSHLLPDGSWSRAQNLQAPINSGADDYAFVIDRYFTATDSILQSGYFSSNRRGGQGSDDIYLYEKRKYYPVKEEPVEEFEYEIVLDLRVFQRQYEDPDDPNSKVLMRVPLPNAKIVVTEDGRNFTETGSNQYGIMTLKLNPDKEYGFFASHEGFFNNELIFSTRDLEIDSSKRIQKFEDKILLNKIFYDKEIVLENIYYDLDESFIREDAKPTLDSLANLLKINPVLNIQLSSHTDCRADDDYNLGLSQDRAQSAVDYLVSKGITTQRMKAVGYGETALAINCDCDDCTEDQHQQNRRTTFKVVE